MEPPAMLHEAISAVRTVLLILALLPIAASAQKPKIDAQMPLETLQAYSTQGNADAMLELGERLVQGRDMTANLQEGLAWIQKAASAGKLEAWYELGVVYANAIGVQRDIQRAMTYFRIGAKGGNADCQCSLGLLYQAGEKIPGGVKADLAQARKWFRNAADQGHQEAILHLAQLIMFGEGGTADPVVGAQWFRKGAELGNPEAQWSLGQCYLEGMGVPKDSVQSYALYAAAAFGVDNPDEKKGMGERRDTLGKNLSQQQLLEAERLAATWKARQIKEVSNSPH